MVIYIGLFVYVCILGLFLFYKKGTINLNARKKTYLFLTFLPLALIMGLRDVSVGTDTELYKNIFLKYGDMNSIQEILNEGTTIIWALYNKIIYEIFQSYNVMLLINSFIICGLCAKFIYNNSDNVVLSTIFFMTFYHYFSAFNISRQYIAIMISINSFKYIKEKKPLKFCLINIIAVLIHNTAICTFILALFFNTNISNTKNIKWFVIGTFLVSLLYPMILNVFINIFPHYATYFDSNTYFNETGNGRRILVTIFYIMIFIYTLILLKTNKNIENVNKNEIQTLNMINLITIIIGFVSLTSVVLARFEKYFSIYIILLLPSIIKHTKKDSLLIGLIFIIISIVPMVFQLNSNYGEIIPYIFNIGLKGV